MSKKMKNTCIWTALAIFPAIVLSFPGIVPSFFERIGVIVLCAPWLIAALLEKDKKAWKRFYIVLIFAVLLAAITYFIRINLNGDNAVAGIIVTLIVANLQRLFSFVLAVWAAVILWRVRKEETTVREEKQARKEWVYERSKRKEQETDSTNISKERKEETPTRKGRTLDL